MAEGCVATPFGSFPGLTQPAPAPPPLSRPFAHVKPMCRHVWSTTPMPLGACMGMSASPFRVEALTAPSSQAQQGEVYNAALPPTKRPSFTPPLEVPGGCRRGREPASPTPTRALRIVDRSLWPLGVCTLVQLVSTCGRAYNRISWCLKKQKYAAASGMPTANKICTGCLRTRGK